MRKNALALIVIFVVVALCACGAQEGKATPTPEGDVEMGRVVSVSGKVLPARWAALSLPLGGRLARVAVSEGQKVELGQELAALETRELELALAAAQEALAAQEAQLARAQEAPSSTDLRAAQAQRDAAQAALKALEDAPLPRDLESARLQVEQAKDTLWAIQLEGNVPGIPLTAQQAARAQAAAAEQSVRLAELQYERVKAGASTDALAAARAAVAQAEVALDALQRGASAAELTGLQAAVRGARVTVAQAEYALSQARLVAPFAATITQVTAREGEFVAPGVPVVTLADLSTLRIETTDLDQTDLGRVELGQAVTLTFDALPDAVLHGHVTRIADMATAGQGGTNFAVLIELDQPEPRLRWGMTAFADISI